MYCAGSIRKCSPAYKNTNRDFHFLGAHRSPKAFWVNDNNQANSTRAWHSAPYDRTRFHEKETLDMQWCSYIVCHYSSDRLWTAHADSYWAQSKIEYQRTKPTRCTYDLRTFARKSSKTGTDYFYSILLLQSHNETLFSFWIGLNEMFRSH